MARPKPSSLRTLLVALSLLLNAGEGAAQSIGRMAFDDVTNAARDFAAIWVAPFRGGPKDYLIAGGVLAVGAAVSPLDDNVDRWMFAHQDRGFLDALGPIRRGGDFYSLNKAAPYVGGLYIVGLATKHRGIRDGIFGCAAAYSANTTMRHQVIYRLIGRNRPDTLRDHPEGYVPTGASDGDQYVFHFPARGYGDHSFPGGHVATMTTCATFLSHRFEMGLVEPALGVLVAAMGIGRMADRGHWLSDQVVGVAFGYAIGKEVARRQKRRLVREKPAAPSTESAGRDDGGAPFMGSDANGTRLGWQQPF
jgi:membrane-associated phospholipid phosphatase